MRATLAALTRSILATSTEYAIAIAAFAAAPGAAASQRANVPS